MSGFLFFFQLIQTNKLKHYPSIHGDFSNDFKQPCVVFTGHPSLRFGDVVHFMELWGKSSLNTVIFTGKSNADIIIKLTAFALWLSVATSLGLYSFVLGQKFLTSVGAYLN